jgi:uncharacterized membrane protein YphA (DoxX/SURF4 family)
MATPSRLLDETLRARSSWATVSGIRSQALTARFNAVLVGYSELLCGAALVIGLATRVATIPLCVSMLVALATAAKASGIHGLFDLVG